MPARPTLISLPRPQLKREKWTNLNGTWNYTVTPIETHQAPAGWSGTILVPYNEAIRTRVPVIN